MSVLAPYLTRKQAVLAQRQADFQAAPDKATVHLKVSSWVAGNTGARPVRMGETMEFYVCVDVFDFAKNGLG